MHTAGLGDIAVGVLALSALLAVDRRMAGWQGKVRMLVCVGLLDFAGVFGTAIVSGEGVSCGWPGKPRRCRCSNCHWR